MSDNFCFEKLKKNLKQFLVVNSSLLLLSSTLERTKAPNVKSSFTLNNRRYYSSVWQYLVDIFGLKFYAFANLRTKTIKKEFRAAHPSASKNIINDRQ